MLYMTLHQRALEDNQHKQLLYPYHLQKIHELIPEDFPRRMQFANWLLDQQRNNVNFISKILFTDEASFTKNGITNLHNARKLISGLGSLAIFGSDHSHCRND
ncbi:hypothetical protein NQ318_010182 [Aromia moschata]|uniref:Uncharacterized protein n=1 Tax=Aromia moschata TaxID=1265417 RepID=A0AAV8XRJ2_9CUCU|nr:hypothetical protein NQ318_010182 [Aromia moschata]